MITLYRPGRLGDVVLLGAVTGSLGACRVATEARYHPVAARLRGVVEVVTPDRAHRDGLVDLQANLRSRLRFPAVRRIRKHTFRRRVWLRLGWPRRPSVPDLYARALGVRPAPLPWIDLSEQPRDTLVLVPGAAWGPKRADRAALLGAGRAWPGPVAVLGGPGEEALVHDIAGRLGAEAVVEAGFRTTLRVLARAALTVSGDTGLMHLAGASGSPVIALFGPTHPDDGFFVYPGTIIQNELSCRPCSLHRVERCARGDLACMSGLSGPVVAAVRRAYLEFGGDP